MELSDQLSCVLVQEQQLAAARLALIAEADGRDLARRFGATSTATWLRDCFRISLPVAKRMIELARALDGLAAATGVALAGGTINEAQAQVIAKTLAALVEHADTETRAKAEQRLLNDATDFDAIILNTLGQRVLDNVAPEIAEEKLAKDLAAADARAANTRTLSLSPDGTGRTRITGWLATDAAAIVNAALDPLCAPISGDERTPGQRRADALTEICRLALNTGELPDNGGEKPQIAITMRFDDLAARVGAGMLDTGLILSPETVRRLACDAAILPTVLGGQGQVLDIGRERRLFTGPLRRALVLRDAGCAFPGVRHEALSTFVEVRDLHHRDIALLR